MITKKCVLLNICIFLLCNSYAQIVLQSADEAVQFALVNVKSYQYQKMTILENMQMSKYSIQDFLPTLGINYSETDSISMDSSDTRSKSIQVSLQQEIFDGGKRKLAYEMSQLNSMYAFQEYEQSIRSFSSSVIAMYYSYLMQEEKVAIREDLIDAAKKQLLVIEKEAELGLTLETDYLEYLISFIKLENEKKQMERDLDRLLRNLKITLGMNAEVELEIHDILTSDVAFMFLQPHFDLLWALIKRESLDLKKGQTSLSFAQKQDAYTDRWYIPSIGIQGSLSFSGEQFPLTEPNYSMKMVISFPNSKVFPLSFSNGYGFNSDGLYNVANTSDLGIVRSTTSIFERRLGDISILQALSQQKDTENAIYESLQDMVFSHDDYVDSIDVTERIIVLEERRLGFMKLEMETGEVKAIDYLNELIAFAETQTSLLEIIAATQELERNIEIASGISFGEIRNVCE